MPDGMVGRSSLCDFALLFFAASAPDRRRQSKTQCAQLDNSGGPRACDRSFTFSRCFDVQANLLEARGRTASLSSEEWNKHADYFWRAQRFERHS